ncbi:hypothetical protein AB6A40_010100 [Gnathostoma spinigerum]|uniref:Adenosine 5'-monophosphoramidase HINT3 n=1 Tax=Gnathostoma spinigerum TaxID=75299 RepID=A0ABD6EU59_9BILA
MASGVQDCVFCHIIQSDKRKYLKETENTVVINDRSPKAPHHYLVLSKRHIARQNDLTPADIDLVKEME